jgi:hypothetical protein
LSESCAGPAHGSLDKEGGLEFGLIGRGMRFMFLLNDNRPVTTSRCSAFMWIDPPSFSLHHPQAFTERKGPARSRESLG